MTGSAGLGGPDRWKSLALLLLAMAVAPGLGRATAPPSAWPRSMVGTADVRVEGDDGRTSSRLVFAAAIDPFALRIELVRGGQVTAVLWSDPDRVLILLPGEPPLLHEGAATRQTLEQALGIPFCPEDLAFALRAGRAPDPGCGTSPEVEVRGGRVVALRRSSPLASVEFSRFQGTGSDAWPRRAVLEAAGTRATVTFSTLERRPSPPLPPDERVLAPARRVDAPEVARALGIASAAGGP